jgi:hypothetical protein
MIVLSDARARTSHSSYARSRKLTLERLARTAKDVKMQLNLPLLFPVPDMTVTPIRACNSTSSAVSVTLKLRTKLLAVVQQSLSMCSINTDTMLAVHAGTCL